MVDDDPETGHGADQRTRVEYLTRHDPQGDRTLAEQVVHAVAVAAGDRTEVHDARLGDRLDPDALNDLFRPRASSPQAPRGGVWFTFRDHRVLVYETGRIEVRPRRRWTTGRRDG